MATAPSETFNPIRAATEDLDRTGQIIAAAYDLLAEQGLEGLTIRAVLARTGLARRAFYDRFVGKDDLVLAVFDQTLRASAGYFREMAGQVADPLDSIKVILTNVVQGGISPEQGTSDADYRRTTALSREHLRLAESRPADLQAALSPLLDLIAELLREGMAQGAIRQCDPALTAALLFNLAATTVHTEILAGGNAEDQARRQRLAEEIWEFSRRAISA